MKSLEAQDIMVRKVVTFTSEMSVHDAMSQLLSDGFSGASVIDSSGILVGVLSEKDCMRVVADEVFERLPEGFVGDFMSRTVTTVSPSTSFFDVVSLFLNRPFRRLPVVEKDGRLVGQISRRDVLRAIESMRKEYLYPKQERVLETGSAGLGGVSSAMKRALGR